MLRLPPTFTTARLHARRARPEDAEAIFHAYASDPEVTRYLSWRAYHEPEAVRAWLEESSTAWETHEGHRAWLLCPHGSEAPIGSIGVTTEPGKVMFGYVLGRAWWGQGFMSEALRHLVTWALAEPGIYRAWAYCDAANPASARVMEKAGMTREGLLRRWMITPAFGPEPRDALIYARVR